MRYVIGPLMNVQWRIYRTRDGCQMWQENGTSTWSDEDQDIPEHGCLLGHLEFCGAAFHVEAILVTVNDQGIQEAVDPSFETNLDHISALCGDGPLETIKIPPYDGDFVVVIYPFAT